MRKTILLILLAPLLLMAGPAGAYTDASGEFTFGPAGYTGISASVEWGDDDHYFRPSVSTYKSDGEDSSTTYSFSGGLERDLWSASAELSLFPETDGYSKTGIYADLIVKPSGPVPFLPLKNLSAGVFASASFHEDLYAASTYTVTQGRRGGTELQDPFRLTQTDYGVTLGASVSVFRAGARFSKTAYDKDVTDEERALPLDLGNIGAEGFQDSCLSFSLGVPGMPLSPEAGYSRTAYLLGQPASETFSFGIFFPAGIFDISASWENFNPGGGSDRENYWTLGAVYSF